MLLPPSLSVADSPTIVFEGDKVRAEQQKRIEEEVHAPVTDGASDKESAIHVESR